jgi:GT2 family glycosyltransferase
MLVTASIVLYNCKKQDIANILSKLDNNIKIFLIDNSFSNELKVLGEESRVEYIHRPSNPGFGAAHNIAIKKAIQISSKYHFIINPDVFFDKGIVNELILNMENDKSIGMMMPQILNLDGSVQYLPKLLPSPLNILRRKLKIPKRNFSKFINQYELRFVPPQKIYNVPIISGCFTLLNIDAIKVVGLYDDKFFMYFEDWDLSRRIHQKYKTIYYPLVSVYHMYDSGANKSFKLFRIFIFSAVTYFNKWGWFFDKERKKINEKTLSQFI